MPGYGILGPEQGSGLLTWEWAEERLIGSHDYWVASIRPDGRPHLMPVWGVWQDRRLWFSSAIGSRKAKNLRAEARCSISTDNAFEPVVVEGRAELVTATAKVQRYLDGINEKYSTSYGMDFMDPSKNVCVSVTPEVVIGLIEADFTGSPTRWVFD